MYAIRSYYDSLAISIERSPYQDVLEVSGNVSLATEIVNAFKGSVDFRREIQKGDRFALIYHQKVRRITSYNVCYTEVITVIAHRLSTIKDATRIALFKDGHIVCEGSEEELMRSCPEYQNIKNIAG